MKLSSGSPMSSKASSSLPVASSWTRRHANAAELGQAFKAGGDVDAVAKDVAVLDDDVAHIDANAQFDAILRRQWPIAVRQRRLHRCRAAQGVDNADELDQQTVTPGLDHPALVNRYLRIKDFG